MEKSKLKDIILVTSDEKALSYKWEDNAKLLKDIQVVSQEYELTPLREEITFVGYVSNKEQVFVRNPLNVLEYIEITRAEEHIFKSKIKFYKRIAYLLGAKSFSAESEFIEEKKLSIGADLNVAYKVVKIDGSFKKEQTEKFNATYELDSQFEPKLDFDRHRAFEEANQLVKELNFYHEIDIVGLIENNNPNDQNREKSQIVKLQLSSELNDLLEISFNINAMGAVFGLGANFKTTTESLKKIILKTEIVF